YDVSEIDYICTHYHQLASLNIFIGQPIWVHQWTRCLAKLSQLTTLELHLSQVPLKANADQLVPLCTVSHLTFHLNLKSHTDLIELHPAIIFPNVETVIFDTFYLECDDSQHPTTSVTTIF